MADGRWTALEASEEGQPPRGLLEAFNTYPGSLGNFLRFPRSAKKAILEWLLSAKRPQTRATRTQEIARLAAENVRANQWRP